MDGTKRQGLVDQYKAGYAEVERAQSLLEAGQLDKLRIGNP